MDHYLEIQVLPDPEFTENLFMNKIFSKLHCSLVNAGHGEVGVSFPDVDKTLGARLRLHGTALALNRVMAENWLAGLNDHITVSAVQSVPAIVQYRVVSRVQVKSNAERLYRRSVKKGWLTQEQAQERILSSTEQRSKLPFLQLKSTSTGQNFLLFVEQSPLQAKAVSGKFSDYGLSSAATIPCF